MVEYGICPNCNGKLLKRNGRFGAFLSCSNFPKCRFSMDFKSENIGMDWNNIDKCPNCSSELVIRTGKNGKFIGCSNFPKCRFSMDYKHNYGNLNENMSKNINSINEETFSFQNEKYQSKVKLAREFVSSNLSIGFKQFLINKKWDEDIELCMHIFSSNVTNEDKAYIESVLGYAHHRRDKRTSLEYACDLMVGWIIEDCTVDILNALGYNTSLNGADKDRRLLLKPTSSSDLKIVINGKEILIEQVNDFTGYWIKTKHVPLRDKKYLHLKNENSLLFGIDFKNELFFILNVSETESNYIPYHRPFSKPAYALKITENDFYSLNRVEAVFSKILSKY